MFVAISRIEIQCFLAILLAAFSYFSIVLCNWNNAFGNILILIALNAIYFYDNKKAQKFHQIYNDLLLIALNDFCIFVKRKKTNFCLCL